MNIYTPTVRVTYFSACLGGSIHYLAMCLLLDYTASMRGNNCRTT